ncbi:MAG: ABC transporter ATP-binding protein [Nocardioidaceae bacterium]
MNVAIRVSELTKTYPGDVQAVKAISFDVLPGEVFGLLGPNGAGKSTTVGMLTTTIRPSSGSAGLYGYDVEREPLAARAISSVVFQEAVVDRSLTGRRNLDIHARLWRTDTATARRRIDEAAELLRLTDLLDRPVRTYSGGERRRLEIARALVSRPRVLFLDEPTVGLDPLIRAELLDVIGGLRQQATTIFLTTHYLDEAERLCDRLAIVHDGSIVALDTPAGLRSGLGSRLVELRTSVDPARALETLRARGLADTDAFRVGATITIPLHGRDAHQTTFAIERAGVRASSMTTREPTLDDVYLRLTGGQLSAAA